MIITDSIRLRGVAFITQAAYSDRQFSFLHSCLKEKPAEKMKETLTRE